MTFLDLFAGVGGFRRGMELAGHKCVGFCEWDKYATASYTSMHLLTDQQREKLSKMDLKKRQKEILKDEYRNGEWYSNDIRAVHAGNIPRADVWCFGAPCQDFSVAGHRAGLDGDRSSLVREVFRILREIKEEDRPEWLIYENVKGMFSSNRGWDYLAILLEMDEGGYDIEWQIFNSKFYGVPQNRERVYTIGHLRAKGSRKILPIEGADGADSIPIKIMGHRDGYRRNTQVFAPDGITEAFDTGEGGGRGHHVGVPICVGNTNPSGRGENGNCYFSEGLSPAICCNKNDGQRVAVKMFGIDYNDGGEERDVANCLTSRYDAGVSRHKQKGTAVGIVIPVLTPDRAEKRQNGRRFKEDGDEAFTLTAQDRHGVAIQVREATSKGYAEAHEGDSINLALPNSETRRDRVGYQVAQTLDTSCNQGTIEVIEGEPPKADHPGMYVQLDDNCIVWAVWYEKYKCYIAIRKLTPRECFRLQGWTDDYFEKAEFVNSNSQLYKQAGNGVTVNVVYEIGKRL